MKKLPSTVILDSPTRSGNSLAGVLSVGQDARLQSNWHPWSVGFFELIGIHNTLREAIASGTSTSELKKLSAERYRSMRQDGIQKLPME